MAHILIVDDSETEIKFITKILEKIDYKVDSAFTGEEGIQKAKELQPDLVLMDVIMPGKLNGYQATRQITTCPETQSIPVVIVSALNTENDRTWGKMMGAKGYLGKPVKQSELLKEINKQLRKKVFTAQSTPILKI
jgi:twitching motility two-component system response regulator PilH